MAAVAAAKHVAASEKKCEAVKIHSCELKLRSYIKAENSIALLGGQNARILVLRSDTRNSGKLLA